MGGECGDEASLEVLPSMWPEDIGDKARKRFNIEKPGLHQDMIEPVSFKGEPTVVDFQRLLELTNYSEKGSSQLAYLVKHCEYMRANAVRLLNEELDSLSKERREVELKKLVMLEEHCFEDEKYGSPNRQISVLDEECDIWGKIAVRKNNMVCYNEQLDMNAGCGAITHWKERAMQLSKMLEASIQREQTLSQKLKENIENLQAQTSPVGELSEILKRADNFLHFILQTAPVVIGHQDKELRYRFIFNHYPSLEEEDIIGKTDTEICAGNGVQEIQAFKKEVLDRGLPAKREITVDTPLFGVKTFLLYVEPVFNKQGETIGVNYVAMDVTDQVARKEKMMKLREEIAVQKAKEVELNKTIRITEETMQAKQMLATMSHEIRSPLAGVVSVAEVLAGTKLDKEQHQLVDVMLSSGDLVLQLINDILDLSKFESGAMKLEATKFRPREVVKHVLQTAAASLKKELTLEGHVADDVPNEVIGDVLRIRQILTNLISNAVKFTHEGKVGINFCVASEQFSGYHQAEHYVCTGDATEYPSAILASDSKSETQNFSIREISSCSNHEDVNQKHVCIEKACLPNDNNREHHPNEKNVWLHCNVYDTGIGIPEKALPSLFEKYMQVSADHTRKYGGTGLGLAICKQLVELMGGNLSVISRENQGSTFSFMLPCEVPPKIEHPYDDDELSANSYAEQKSDPVVSVASGSFIFMPQARFTSLPHEGSTIEKTKLCSSTVNSQESLGLRIEKPGSISFNRYASAEALSVDDVSPVCDNSDGNGSIQNRDDFQGGADGTKAVDIKNLRLTCQISKRRRIDKNSPSASSSNTAKILLVEDNKVNIVVAKSMLEQLGHKIEIAKNGLEAIHAVQRSQYDLILMDVHMPVMDGLQATRLIRAFEKNGYWDASVGIGDKQVLACSDVLPSSPKAQQERKKIPIIAMTANAFGESRTECLASGMDSFISKPVTFQILKKCLQQYLSSQTL